MNRNSDHDTQSLQTRDEIDPIFKEVLSFRFGQLAVPVQTQVEVSRIARTIDALILLTQTEDLEKVQTQTPFVPFCVHNQIEFKGRRDPLTIWDYHLILGRTHFYIGENKIEPSEMMVTIVCAGKPRKVLYQSDNHAKWTPVGSGHYISAGEELSVRIIVCNELEMTPKNYPLLLFSSSKRKFRRFLQHLLETNHLEYIRFAYRVHPQLTKEVLTMAGRHRTPKEDLEFIAKDIGAELVPFISLEDLKRGLSKKDLEFIAKDIGADLLPFLRPEDIVRGLDASALIRLKQLLEDQIPKQKSEEQEN